MKAFYFVFLTVLMSLTACSSEMAYLNSKGNIELGHDQLEGVLIEQKFKSEEEAKLFTKEINESISKWNWDDKNNFMVDEIVFTPVPNDQQNISHWLVGMSLDYQIPTTASVGKHIITLTCIDNTGKVLVKSNFTITISTSKRSYELKTGFIALGLGILIFLSAICLKRKEIWILSVTGKRSVDKSTYFIGLFLGIFFILIGLAVLMGFSELLYKILKIKRIF